MEIKEGISRAGKTLRAAVEGLDTRPPEIAFEDVKARSVAGLVFTQMGNRVRKKFGQGRWDNPFTASDLLANI